MMNTVETVSDKQLIRAVWLAAIGILLCMVCLVGTTYAWYTLSTESGRNVMEAATFDIECTVFPSEGGENVEKVGNAYTLDPALTYTVSLAQEESSNSRSGFCRIAAYTSDSSGYTVYFTQNIPYDTETSDGNAPYQFSVTGLSKIEISPMWGICTGPLIVENVGSIPLDAQDGQTKQDDQPSESVSDISSEPVSDISSEPVSDISSEPVSDLPSEPVSDVSSEPVSDVSSEPTSDFPSELIPILDPPDIVDPIG